MGGGDKVKLSRHQLERVSLLIILYLLVITVGGYSFNKYIFKPLKTQTSAVAADNKNLEVLLQRLGNIKEEDICLENQILYEDWEKLSVKVPGVLEEPEIISFLADTARDTGVQFISLTYENSEPGKKLGSKEDDKNEVKILQFADFEIKIKGDYFNLLNFMARVENAPRIYAVHYLESIKKDDSFIFHIVYRAYHDNLFFNGSKKTN